MLLGRVFVYDFGTTGNGETVMRMSMVAKSFLVLSALLMATNSQAQEVLSGSDAAAMIKGKKQLSQTEVIELFSGKSIPWSSGGGYYYPDGSLKIIWKGKELPSGTWRVNEEGRDCITSPKWWGDNEKCQGLWYFVGEDYFAYNNATDKGHLKLRSRIYDGDQTDRYK